MEETKPHSVENPKEKCVWKARDPIRNQCAWLTLHPGVSSCILHDLNSEKDLEAFKEAFNEIQSAVPKGGTICLNGAIFPSSWSIQQWKYGDRERGLIEWDRSVSFCVATFHCTVSIDHGWFNGMSNFEGAIFQENLVVGQTPVGDFSFRDATFHKKVDFSDVALNEISFKGARFFGKVSFQGEGFSITFNKNAEFGKTMFHDEISFSSCHFKEQVRFDNATFQENANASFTNTIFHQGVTFRSALLKGKTPFFPTHPKFQVENIDSPKIPPETGEINFDGAQFHQEVSLDTLIFEGEVSFRKALFMKEVSFHHTAFQQNVDFNGASFEADVSFKETSFKGDVLLGADFKSQASFIGTKANLLFTNKERAINTSFEGARFF